jgi:hypothetical protein
MDYAGVTDQIIGRESGGNPLAANPYSSASGLGQFTNGTWLDMIKRHRPDLAGNMSDSQILALKTDPNLSRQMTQAYAQDNAGYLSGRGAPVTPGSLRLAHFAGPAGASAIYANPNATVASLLGPAAVKANPFLANMTGQDAINWAEAQMDPAKMMARGIRQRFVGSASPQGGATPATDASPAGMEKLKSALAGQGYDPEAITAADTTIKQGQQIGQNATNWLGAIGGPLVSLFGNYQKSQESEKKKAQDATIANALTGATTGKDLANTLISSSDPQMRAAGIELKAKLATQKPEVTFGPIGQNTDQFGNTTTLYGSRDPRTGEVKPYIPPKQETGAQPQIDPNLKGNDYLDAVNSPLAQKAKNIIAGREALPNATRGDKTALQVQQLVRQADPDYNANRYHYRQQWESPNNPIGKARIANNTAIGHMGELDKLVDNLPDASLGPLSYRGNQLYNWWEGGSNNAQLKKWADTAQLLSGEIVKVATGGEGSIQDREKVMESLNPANGQASLKQQIANYVTLLASKTNALADDWKQTMGPYADQPNLLSGHSRETLQRLLGAYAPGTQLSLPGATAENPDQPKGVKTLRYNPQTGELEEK